MLKHFGKEALMVDGHSREELVVLRYWEAKREVPLHWEGEMLAKKLLT